MCVFLCLPWSRESSTGIWPPLASWRSWWLHFGLIGSGCLIYWHCWCSCHCRFFRCGTFSFRHSTTSSITPKIPWTFICGDYPAHKKERLFSKECARNVICVRNSLTRDTREISQPFVIGVVKVLSLQSQPLFSSNWQTFLTTFSKTNSSLFLCSCSEGLLLGSEPHLCPKTHGSFCLEGALHADEHWEVLASAGNPALCRIVWCCRVLKELCTRFSNVLLTRTWLPWLVFFLPWL